MSASAPPRRPSPAGRPAGRAPEASTSDAVLVRLAADGDDAAFEALFVRHRPAVHAYAVRMLQDHGRAEDVVQDVFFSAMRALHDGREPTYVAAWLREIARRTCIDQWRSATRRGEVSLDAPERLASGDARRLADDDSLARATEDRESVATLRRAFQDLPALQHAVLVQRELEGRAPDEIAARLGLSRTVVEGQLARGRRALARAYRELQSGERCAAARVLCDASLHRPLGVRERGRLGGHLRGCDACRRHAHALGVETRLFDRGLAAKVALLVPLPLLRRWAAEPTLTGEAAGGALGAKVLVSAAVLAAGSGGVYATRDAPAHGWPDLGSSVTHRADGRADASTAVAPGGLLTVAGRDLPLGVGAALPSGATAFAPPGRPGVRAATAGGASTGAAPAPPADRAAGGPAALAAPAAAASGPHPTPAPASGPTPAPTSGPVAAPSGRPAGPPALDAAGGAARGDAPADGPRGTGDPTPAAAPATDVGGAEDGSSGDGNRDAASAPAADGAGSTPAGGDHSAADPVAPVAFAPAPEGASVAMAPGDDGSADPGPAAGSPDPGAPAVDAPSAALLASPPPPGATDGGAAGAGGPDAS